MRQKIVAVLLFALLVAFGIIVAVRPRAPHAPLGALPESAPAVSVAEAPSAAVPEVLPSASAPAPSAPSDAASAPEPQASAPSVPSASSSVEAPAPSLERPLRVIVQGWALAAPGLLANGSLRGEADAPLRKRGLDAQITVAEGTREVEQALARGGADAAGADVAVVPLSAFVASYERLAALSPEAFFVAGWSRGRDAIGANKDVLTTLPSGDVSLAGEAGAPSTLLGLFALDVVGASPQHIKLLPLASAPEAQLVSLTAGAQGEQPVQVRLSTSDASGLVPYVAVAPRSLIERQPAAIEAWAAGWLDGQALLSGDAPTAARLVASSLHAPEPLALLEALGQMKPASLADNAAAFALQESSPARPLEQLFALHWRLWRGVGALGTSAPTSAPLSRRVVTSLVASQAKQPEASKQSRKGDLTQAKVVLTYRQRDGVSEDALLVEAKLLGAVFERAALRVGVKKGAGVDAVRTKALLEKLEGSLGPDAAIAASKPIAGAQAAIEVLVFP